MKVRPNLTENQKMLGLALASPTLFLRAFWASELSLPPSTRQKLLWNDKSPRVILATGRKVAKSLYIESRIIRGGITHQYDGSVNERMVVTPGDNQRDPVWSRVTSRINRTPLFNILCKRQQKNEGTLVWQSGVIHYFRIDGSDGTDRNMVGLRLHEILGDEMQLTTRVPHNSRKQSALPSCKWAYCGVPDGVHGTPFYNLDKTIAGFKWSHHKISTYANPLYWSQQMREQLIADYGEGSQDYVTQVMGMWGEQLFSSFPPDALKFDATLPYRIGLWRAPDIPLEVDNEGLAAVTARLSIPRVNAARYVIGMDYGFLQDPTEIGIAYQREESQGRIPTENDWRMLMRIHIEGANPLAQARFLQFLVYVLGEDKVARVCLDEGGAGIAVASALMESDKGLWWAGNLFDFAASGSTEVDPVGAHRDDLEVDGFVSGQDKRKVRNKEYYTRILQGALMAARMDSLGVDFRLTLGTDEDMRNELIATRQRKTEFGNTVYLPLMLNGKQALDHITDMLRCTAAAISRVAEGEGSNEEDLAALAYIAGDTMFKPVPLWQRSGALF